MIRIQKALAWNKCRRKSVCKLWYIFSCLEDNEKTVKVNYSFLRIFLLLFAILCSNYIYLARSITFLDVHEHLSVGSWIAKPYINVLYPYLNNEQGWLDKPTKLKGAHKRELLVQNLLIITIFLEPVKLKKYNSNVN